MLESKKRGNEDSKGCGGVGEDCGIKTKDHLTKCHGAQIGEGQKQTEKIALYLPMGGMAPGQAGRVCSPCQRRKEAE